VPPASSGITPPSKAPMAAATASFTITIPSRSGAANSHAPRYVSIATQSIIITLATVNGTPFTGSPASIASNLTVSNPACTGVPLTCTIVAPAVVGNDVFNVATYDAQQTSASPVTPIGHVLSQATTSVTVVANQANVAPPMVLNGVAASITVVTPSGDPHVLGSPATGYQLIGNQPYILFVAALDAAGVFIIDPGAPTFTMQSGSSAVVVTPVGGNRNAFTVRARSFSGSPVPLSITMSNSSLRLDLTLTTVQELWVADAGNSTITGYAGSPPTHIVGDTITAGLQGPNALAFDGNGILWVTNFGNVTAYSGTTQILADTITAGLSAPIGLAFDPSGVLWVGDWPRPGPGTVNAYSGTTQLTANTISNPQALSTGLWGPRALAFDVHGNLWVANGGGGVNTVTAYAGSAQLGANTITAGISAPFGLAFDGSGNLWVANVNTNTITAYAGTAPLPGGTITAGLSAPAGIAFDASGHLWVANESGANGHTITAYAGTSQISANTIASGLSVPIAVAFAPTAALPASTISPGPTPTPTPTPISTFTPGSTPTPTPTPIPPFTPTPTPVPPLTPTPTPTPTLMPTPTPTPTMTPTPDPCAGERPHANQCPFSQRFLASPLKCADQACSVAYDQGVYTKQIMNSVLDHSLKQNPNGFWQYGFSNELGGDGRVTAFNGESVNGPPLGSTPLLVVCVGGALHIPTLPRDNSTDLVRHPGGCGDANYASYDEHPGYDYRAAPGTPVYAAAGGIVVMNFHEPNADGTPKMCVDTNVVDTCTAKNYVGIDHQLRGLGGYISQYGHLSVINVSAGDTITQGQLIGYSGEVGAPKNPHLHFEVIKLLPGLPNNYNAYNYAIVDPYGWTGGGTDPLVGIFGGVSVQLWQ